MNRVGKFEKVSFEQFRAAMEGEFNSVYSDAEIKEMYDKLVLPVRATSGSAGYDIKSPFEFTLKVGESIKIPTGLRVLIDEGWWLGCFPRSGLGFKYRLQLDNGVGIIDLDYAFSDNEGHIFLKITNDGKAGKTIHVDAGDGFAQAIFLPFGITYDDDVTAVRNGGFGSTGK